MTKLIKKTNCKFKNNMIVCKDKVVAPEFAAYNALHELDRTLQKAEYILEQPKPSPVPSLEGFKFKHVYDERFICNVLSPEVMAIEELKSEEAAMLKKKALNDLINTRLTELRNQWLDAFVFAGHKSFVDCGEDYDWDLPVLGNPLKITGPDLAKALWTIVQAELHQEGMEVHVFDDEDFDDEE